MTATPYGLPVPARELAFDQPGVGWVLEPGVYRFEVGRNAADLRLSGQVRREGGGLR